MKHSLVFAMLLAACGSKSSNVQSGTKVPAAVGSVSDFDGTAYPIMQIGTQRWTGKNLAVTHYDNGDPIPLVQDASAWAALTTGAYAVYENKSENQTTYGLLYNWYAVTDPRGIAPKGWTVPAASDWVTLSTGLGGDNDSGGKLKDATAWTQSTDATNASGFTALPGGYRDRDGVFTGILANEDWWSTSDDQTPGGDGSFVAIAYFNGTFDEGHNRKTMGLAVRCLQNP